MSPENVAMNNPVKINNRAGRIATIKADEAAEGDSGTVKNEARYRLPPRMRKPFPRFCKVFWRRNCIAMPREAIARGIQRSNAALISSCMTVVHGIRLMNIPTNFLPVGLIALKFSYDSNKYPSIVAKMFR
tara:strand:- start:2382 stop:2774 length:393 start_codon:yes stop_codon:yes gene_type:complete